MDGLPLNNSTHINGHVVAHRQESASSILHKYKKWMANTKFALLVLISILLIICTAALIFLVVRSVQNGTVEDADFLNRETSWRDKCQRECKADFDVPPLLVISMDGFHADYLDRQITPAIQRIMNCGTRAEFMFPSYPSKTFPNHYTIVTGLYPESHGIIDNHFVDFELNETYFSKASRNPDWYYGEPIWNTVIKNGRKSAVFFWPGSEVKIQGMGPDYRMNYSNTTPFSTRVDQISMFITVYLMDMQQHANESYLSAFGKAILQRRMAQSTIACFLMGIDVTLAPNAGK